MGFYMSEANINCEMQVVSGAVLFYEKNSCKVASCVK